MALTIDDFNTAFAPIGVTNTADLGAFVGNLGSLMQGLAGAGLSAPGALAAAGNMVKREIAQAQIGVKTAELQKQITDTEAARQALQAQVAALNAQLGK